MRKNMKTLYVTGLTTLFIAAFAFSAFAAVNQSINDSTHVKDGDTYYDKNSGCAYMSPDTYVGFYTEEGSHYASSGKGSGSSQKTEWVVKETATGKVWIPKGETLESTDIYLQNGYVVKREPAKWVAKEPDEVVTDKVHTDGEEKNPDETWSYQGGAKEDPPKNNISDKNSSEDSEISDEDSDFMGSSQDKPNGGDINISGTIPGETSSTSRVDNITDMRPGDISVNNGTITGTITVPGGKDYDFTLKPNEDGSYDIVTNVDTDTNTEFDVTASYVGEDTELEDYWYTFTGDNLDNALISDAERHTDFGIGEKEVRKASFRKVLRIPGTWKIDSTYWEQLGIYKVYDVEWGPDAQGNSGSTPVREKVDTVITSEAVRPQFPQYVPVPLVCVDCPDIEICVNGACDCIDSTNTVCSNTDREEAENQLNSYDINSDSVLEK